MTTNFDNEVVEGNKGKASTTDGEPNMRAKNMTFTRPLNMGPIDFDNEVMNYLRYAEETGKDGYLHYQGYVCWKSARWTYACKKKYGHYFGKMRGALVQNDDYIEKQNKPQTFGKRPKQGERTDLTEIVDEIKNGRSVDDIVLTQPLMYHKYGRTLNKVEDIILRNKIRTEQTTGYWYVGKTEQGKSARAYLNYNIDEYYSYPYDCGWWDGYKGQHTVILDEFRGQLQYNEMLRLIDRHPNYYCRRRGREPIPFTSKRVIITSSLTPQEVYHNLQHNDNIDQLLRRIEVIQLGEKERPYCYNEHLELQKELTN